LPPNVKDQASDEAPLSSKMQGSVLASGRRDSGCSFKGIDEYGMNSNVMNRWEARPWVASEGPNLARVNIKTNHEFKEEH